MAWSIFKFWTWFGSNHRIEQALEESSGYDISLNAAPPVTVPRPANNSQRTPDVAALRRTDNRAPAAPAQKLELWTDYMVMPANNQPQPQSRAAKGGEDVLGYEYEAPWEAGAKKQA